MTEMQLNHQDNADYNQNGQNNAMGITNRRPSSRITTPSGGGYGSNGISLPMDGDESQEDTPLLDPNGRSDSCSALDEEIHNCALESVKMKGKDLSSSYSSKSEDRGACKPLTPLRRAKSFLLFIIVVCSTVIYAAFPDLEIRYRQFSVSITQPQTFNISNPLNERILKLYITAATVPLAPSRETNNLIITVIDQSNTTQVKRVAVILPDSPEYYAFEQSQTNYMFNFKDDIDVGNFSVTLYLEPAHHFLSPHSLPGSLFGVPLSEKVENSVIYGIIILLSVYVLIIFELVHRTVAAIIGAFAAIAVMASFNEKPSMEEMVEWIDYDTLALLFGMMIIVSIITDTGIFDWFALQAYKLAKGKTWPLITMLCVFAAVVSAFLDNVTTILLLTPVTIRLCEVLDIDPKHVMIAEVIFSNIGGAATGIGDPPNVIILSNPNMQQLGIDFGTFTAHMSIGSIVAAFAAYALLRLMYRRKDLLRSQDPPEVSELLREIEIWRHACQGMVIASREENTVKALLYQKIATLENMVERKRFELKSSPRGWKIQVSELEKIYYIRDLGLLIKSALVLGLVIVAFFLQSFVDSLYLNLGWIPIFGAVWILVISDIKDLDSILHRIEWATLLFFAALFILMESLTRLRVIEFITDQVTTLIISIPESSRLAGAICILLWISALASSFIDNIPYTTAMIPVIVNISGDPDVNLPLEPLVYALAFGACLGGNGTLIGASANVVSAGIAETHGHGFSFLDFFKVGFPMMILTTLVAMIYLLITHVAFAWGDI